MLPHWHIKDPGHSAKSAGDRLHLNVHTPLPHRSRADYAAVQAKCGNLSGNELTCNSSGNTWSQLSQLTEPLWTDPGLKSGIRLRELISTLKRKKKQAQNELSNILPKSSHGRRKSAPLPPCTITLRH